MKFSIIVAASENEVIGFHGEMPWKKMKGDLRFFKEKTSGKWCILGRKTYKALGNKTLPGRKFIIITRDKEFISQDSHVVHSIEEAVNFSSFKNDEEIMVLGGAEIYKQIMPFIDRIYLTRIHASFEGDAFFETPGQEWSLIKKTEHDADENNPHDYDFLIYERK